MSLEATLLIVDDDQDIRELLSQVLEGYGYRILLAEDGQAMWKVLESHKPDLIILDVMMPGDDGFVLCRKLRDQSDMPIIMLTAIGEATDKIVGLEMGADDYITKPFNPRELVARVKALLRRSSNTRDTLQADPLGASKLAQDLVTFDGWVLDLGSRRLTSPHEVDVTLSGGEFDLLKVFIEHPRRVLSRDYLLDITRNRTAMPFDRSIDVQVSRLRHKVEQDPKKPEMIKTVRGGGYIFTPKVEKLNLGS